MFLPNIFNVFAQHFPSKQKCVTALDQTWHPDHFFCAQCGCQFGDDGFHEKDGKPYCKADYLGMFALKCKGCNMAITEGYISALSAQWHPQCFVCRVSCPFSVSQRHLWSGKVSRT
jgi:paxillin